MLCYDFKIVSKNIASSSGLSSEVCTITCAYIDDDTIYKTPVSDGGIIVDRIKVPILSAQALASLFYLFG